MVKDPKMAKSFSRAFYIKCFHNYELFFHVYQLHALIYGLKFILEFKKLEIAKKNMLN
jgi:hypothetical protein